MNGGITISVKVELPQLFETMEGVGFEPSDVVLGQRQMLHRRRNALGNLSQSTSVAQHLHTKKNPLKHLQYLKDGFVWKMISIFEIG